MEGAKNMIQENIDRMFYEYVLPSVALTVLFVAFLLVAQPGKALDKELKFQDQVYNLQRR